MKTMEIRIIFLVLVLLCVVMLTACSGVAPVVVTSKDVLIPGTQVPCPAVPPPMPVWATDVLPKTATYMQKILAMGEEINQRAAYEIKVKAALEGCIGKQVQSPVVQPAPTTFADRFKAILNRGH